MKPPPLPTRRPSPTLRVVGWLFIAGGALALANWVTSALSGNLFPRLGVVGIFVGVGLLRLSRAWRVVALVIVWINLVSIPLVVILFLIGEVSDLGIFGLPRIRASIVPGLLVGTGMMILNVWEYCVLMSSRTRALFGLGGRTGEE